MSDLIEDEYRVEFLSKIWRMNAETEKLVAEQRELIAEKRKLHARLTNFGLAGLRLQSARLSEL